MTVGQLLDKIESSLTITDSTTEIAKENGTDIDLSHALQRINKHLSQIDKMTVEDNQNDRHREYHNCYLKLLHIR